MRSTTTTSLKRVEAASAETTSTGQCEERGGEGGEETVKRPFDGEKKLVRPTAFIPFPLPDLGSCQCHAHADGSPFPVLRVAGPTIC